MNTLKVDLSVALNLLTPTANPNTYALIAKFFNSAGAPLNNPNVPNSQTVEVQTTNPNFSLNIPINNGNYSVNSAQLRIFSQDGSCCFAARTNLSFTNLQTVNPTFSHELTQPTCSGTTLTPGKIRIFNPQNATRYKVCYNTSTFNCANCQTSDGLINQSGDTIINLNLPADNSQYDFIVRIYNGSSCSFYTDISTSQTWVDCQPPIVVTPQAVLLSDLNNGGIYRYEPSTGNLAMVYNTGNTSPDIAHTATKMFVLISLFNGSGFDSKLREYNITLNPFTQSFSRDYAISSDHHGNALCAVSNTELYVGLFEIYKIVLSGSTATVTEMFALPSGYHCTGDLIYDPSTDLFLISYDNGTDFKLGVFEGDGTLVRSGTAPSDTIYSIYQFAGATYLISGGGLIYQFNLTAMTSSLVGNLSTNISGGSQIQSNISIPS